MSEAFEQNDKLRKSSFLELLLCDRGPAEGRPLVFHHIQKTAGTSLRHVIRTNLDTAERLAVRIGSDVKRTNRMVAHHAELVESLSPGERARLSCAMGHTAINLLPYFGDEADYLTIVREPVDRVLSQFYFSNRRARRYEGDDLLALYQGRDDVLRKGKIASRLCNWQSRTLLAPFHDLTALEAATEPLPDADEWRSRIRDLVDRFWLVGVQDRFDELVSVLCERCGWTPVEAHFKVSKERDRDLDRLDPGLRELIGAANWLDAELYRHCGERFDRLVDAGRAA